MANSIDNIDTKLNDISGFPELSLKEEIVMQNIIKKIKEVYGMYGYIPMETRLVEPVEILQQKGIDSKEVFVLSMLHKGEIREKDADQQTLALRFDLTVPLSRFVAQQYKSLLFPLKRYQIQKVYRGETAVASHGRYCEFYQSDIDVIGKNSLDIAYDSEFPCVIYEIFRKVIGIDRFVIRISNRKLLEGLFQEFGMDDPCKLKKAVKVIDDLEKISTEIITERLIELDLKQSDATNILQFFKICREHPSDQVVKLLSGLEVNNKLFKTGIDEIATVINGVLSNNIPLEYIMVDPSIARGLDYYTGTVYETTLLDMQYLGSVCSGGRYDELVGTLSGDTDNKFPGCGISIGLTRLVPALIRGGVLKADVMTMAQVFVAIQDTKYTNICNMLATKLRDKGIGVFVNYSGGRLKQQIEYAARAGFRIMLMGRSEFDENKVQIKEIDSKKPNVFVPFDEMCDYVLKLISGYESSKLDELSSTQKLRELKQNDDNTVLAELKTCLS